MKLLNKKSLTALALVGAFSFGNASAMTSITMPLTSVVGVSSSNLRVHVEDGIAHLFGTVENGSESALANQTQFNLKENIMKLSAKQSIAALALIGAMSVGTASAMTSATMPLTSVVGVGSSNLRVHVEDGIAHIFGIVENGSEAALAQAHVEKLPGVDKVINRILLD